MAELDFIPWGLDVQWPSRLWLDFLEGPAAGPFWGVDLGHANDAAALYVCTYPRARFDAAMAGRAGVDDQLREIAFTVTHQLINRVLAGSRVTGDEHAALRSRLRQHAKEQAAAYETWESARWQIAAGESTSREIPARLIELSGWQSGFAVLDEEYVAVHCLGADPRDITLSQVLDPAAYDFTFDDVKHPSTPPARIPGEG